jgi:hypothetical protein
MITEKQLRVIKSLVTIFWQSIFSICCLVEWFRVLNKVLNSNTLFDIEKYSTIEAILSGTLYLAFRFWFPKPTDGKEIKNPTSSDDDRN